MLTIDKERIRDRINQLQSKRNEFIIALQLLLSATLAVITLIMTFVIFHAEAENVNGLLLDIKAFISLIAITVILSLVLFFLDLENKKKINKNYELLLNS